MGTLHEDQYTFITSRSVLPRMRNVSHKSCSQNQNTRFTYNNLFFLENCTVYAIMRKNIVVPGRQQMTICSMHIACKIPKATNTHSQYVIQYCFPLQHWLHECISMSHCMHIACLVVVNLKLLKYSMKMI